jgi:hypothetical protein
MKEKVDWEAEGEGETMRCKETLLRITAVSQRAGFTLGSRATPVSNAERRAHAPG